MMRKESAASGEAEAPSLPSAVRGDVTFTVSDLERAIDFYENVLGLPKEHQSPTCARFDCGGVQLVLQSGPPAAEQGSASSMNFLVQDVDEASRTLRERGIRCLKRPHHTNNSERIALFSDPDGNLLQLVQLSSRRYFDDVGPSTAEQTWMHH